MSMNRINQTSRLHQPDTPAILAHLLRLDAADRNQRFCQPANDAVIGRYVAGLDFDRDVFFGIWAGPHAPQQLAGLAHVAIDPQARYAEIGVSVDADQRRRGIGGSLLDRAIEYAMQGGIIEVVMCFRSSNAELIQLARTHGMRLSVGSGEGLARLGLGAAQLPSGIA